MLKNVNTADFILKLATPIILLIAFASTAWANKNNGETSYLPGSDTVYMPLDGTLALLDHNSPLEQQEDFLLAADSFSDASGITESLENTALNGQALNRATSNTPKSAAEQSEEKAELLQKALLKIYRSNLLKKTYQHVEYPESSIEDNEEGDVILQLTVERNGKVKQIAYHSKSKHHSLNLAARSAVKKARPFIAAPSTLEGERFEILMPIRFRLTD